jgi:hypothetical protein
MEVLVIHHAKKYYLEEKIFIKKPNSFKISQLYPKFQHKPKYHISKILAQNNVGAKIH